MLKGMESFVSIISSIALTVICWGVYGPTLHRGQMSMSGSRLRPLLCVGIAYFAIAVVVPIVWLQVRGEKGDWTATGTAWSLAAGAAGALGALGIILAFTFGGSPSYVMPLVFGCAPVVNAFLTIYWAGTWREVSPMFLAGLILVAVGAFTVLFFAPKAKHGPPAAQAPAASSSATH